ncbi:ComEA family DNA-binding protein [Gallaecimonas sp. GXIMD1310]|uniref:ComEA family DNA-binding protein n=1 Tax=Gallaecimonas sp. GXIMD1310 TaxID=3131926 RepID=UPI003243DE90
MKRTLHQMLLVASILAGGMAPATVNAQSEQANEPAVQQLEESVNVNSASQEELARILKGVGAKKAALIVEHREAHGPFTSLDELKAVKGIGDKLLSANASKIRFK